MAVTFVLGNAHDLSTSLLMPSNSIAAAIANEFTEADTELYRSSLIALAFLLFVVTFLVLTAAKLMLMRIGRSPREDPLTACSCAASSPTSLALLFAGAATLFGLTWLVWILWTTLAAGRGGALARAVHANDSAAGRERRPAQCLLRKRGDGPARARHRHPGRDRRRHLSRRARPPLAPGGRRQLPQRHPAERAVDRHRPVRLRAGRAPVGPFLRLRRRAGARDDPAADRRPDDRRSAAPGARTRCAKRPSRSACRRGESPRGSSTRRRSAGSSPASCSASRASPARPRRCCSPRSTTSSGAPTSTQPLANVPVVIFQYAMSPYDEWHALAWAGALSSRSSSSALNLAVRFLARRGKQMIESARTRRSRVDAGARLAGQDRRARPRLLLRQDACAEARRPRGPGQCRDRDHRPVGLRQVDAAARHQPHLRALSRPAGGRRDRDRRRNVLDPRYPLSALRRCVGMVFQKPTRSPPASARTSPSRSSYYERLPKSRARRPGRGRASPGGAVGRGQGQARRQRACRCRAGSSSGCASPARSPCGPKSSSSTSRPRRSTRSRPPRSRS